MSSNSLQHYESVVTEPNLNAHHRGGSDFFRNTVILFSGTAVAQLIPFLALPLFSRLYTPVQFGEYSVFQITAVLITVIATGRYELASMLPRSDRNALHIIALSASLAVIVSTALQLLLYVFDGLSGTLTHSKPLPHWIYYIPLTIVCSSVYESVGYWLNRKSRFRSLAISAVSLQFASVIGKIVFGITSLADAGLIRGALFGNAVSLAAICFQARGTMQAAGLRLNKWRLYLNARRYKQFPLFNAPSSILNTVSQGLIVVVLGSLGLFSEAGYVAFSRTLIFGPVALIGASLGRVFFQKATISIRTPELERLFNQLLVGNLLLIIPVAVFFILRAPEVYGVLFGRQWSEAGAYARPIAIAAIGYSFTSWNNRLFEVLHKQHFVLLLQLVCDGVTFAAIMLTLKYGGTALTLVYVYSCCTLVFNMLFLLVIYRIAEFKRKGYLRFLVLLITLCFVWLFIGFIVDVICTSTVSRLVADTSMLVIYYCLLGAWTFMSQGNSIETPLVKAPTGIRSVQT